jgi:hypothetical protein
MDNIKSIGQIVQKINDDYTSVTTKTSEYVEFSQFDNNNRIEAYLSSKHISGDVDAQGREKPFMNIVISAVNIWYRATKRRLTDIKIKADKEGNVTAAYMATVLIRNWANKTEFESFLTQWGMTLAAYGSAVTKWVDRGDKLDYTVVKWGNFMSDTIDFYNNVKVEKLQMTQAELMNHPGYDKEVAEDLIESLRARTNLRHEQKDNRDEYIELYEVHGVLPLWHITGKESDKDKFVQQMHVISTLDAEGDFKYEEFSLAKGREDKDPYILTSLLPDPTGQRATGKGAVELLFDAQWMVNHAEKLIKDKLDISKTIFQTTDGNFVGKNATTYIDNGDILTLEEGKQISQVNTTATDITALQNFGQAWNQLSQSITSTPEAMRGGDIKSGTAYRTQQLAVNESSSLFEEMGANKDSAIKEFFREFVIPFVKRKMDTTEEISAILDHQNIKKIDSKFVSNKVAAKTNAKLISQILDEGLMPTPEDQAMMVQEEEVGMKASLAELGNQRFFKPDEIDGKSWKESIKDFEWDVEIDTPTDQKDVNLAMETLSNVLATISDPIKAQALQTPMGKFLFNKILTLTGTISPLELGDIEAAQDLKMQAQTAQSQQVIDPSGQSLQAPQPQMAT